MYILNRPASINDAEWIIINAPFKAPPRILALMSKNPDNDLVT